MPWTPLCPPRNDVSGVNTVELAGVTLGYTGRPILRDVSLSLRPGEFVGLLGPNGAGKTTLLRAILGLVRPSQGTVRVLGVPATRGNPRVGYMPQVRTALAGSRISGMDFIASAAGGERWGLRLGGAKARREVDWALDLVNAANLARRALADLSGGERQRLLLAQALLGRPKLLLLDEPLISLDPRHQQAVVALVQRLQVELQMTVLFSAHELNPLLGAMDRVLYLGSGHAAIGPVSEVVTGPVLSRLYDAEIEVVRAAGRIFVLVGGHEAEHGAHRHEKVTAHVRL